MIVGSPRGGGDASVSGLALFVLAVALVWFAPSWLFLVGALGLRVAACAEHAALARHNGVAVSGVVGGLAALITSASFSGLVDDRARRNP